MFKYLTFTFAASVAFALAMPASAQTDSSQALVTNVSVQTSPIDYAFYDQVLNKLAVKQGGRPRLAYDFIRDQNGDFIGNYVSRLARQNIEGLPKTDQLAYWLNLQNLVAIDAIVKEGKGKRSLKKLRGTPLMPGKLWTKPRVVIAGQNMSLQDIETKVLTEFENPNVIYGIYQGVRGGPGLTSKAYQGATVNEMLLKNAKQYINAKGVVSVKNDLVKVTPIFLWYQDAAFAGQDMVLNEHLKSHAYPRLKKALNRGRSFAAASLNYRLDEYKAPKQETYSSGSRGGGGGYGS
jgi:hypothetical protein